MPTPPDARTLRGHRSTRLGASPFAATVPAIAAAGVFLAAVAVWALAGDGLPGGRWLAVHLFTVGVLSNLVVGFTHHFARTLTRSADAALRWPLLVLLNAGAVTLLVGLPAGSRLAVAAGASVLTAAVFWSYLGLRRARRAAVGARFGWIVRAYERAHGAFVHGAILGALLGTGLLSGGWYGAGRLAHLHVNVLGWGGLTLLATLVFFGPTMMRTRIRPGADDVAARVLRHGATGLTVGVLLLLASGVGGTAGSVLRVASAVALGVYAWGVTRVCVPVVAAARGAVSTPARGPVVAGAGWFALLAWADVGIVAAGAWRAIDALGVVALVGVLGQAITAALGYVAPMLRARSFGGRDVVLARLEQGAGIRTVLYNLAVVGMVVAAATEVPALVGQVARWSLVVAIGWQVVASLWPTGGATEEVRSQAARRYRTSPDAGPNGGAEGPPTPSP